MQEGPALARLAAAVAYRLPDGWDHEPDPELLGAVHGPDGMFLLLRSPFVGCEIRAILPVDISITDLDPRLRARCRIRVASGQDPDLIAGAIVDRLLPVYVPLFHDLTGRAEAEAAAVVGGTAPSDPRGSRHSAGTASSA